jgi:hypothetical protein
MKKLFIVAAVIAGFAFTASAGLDVYDSVTVGTLGSPTLVAVDTTVTNTAVDVANCKGIGNLIITVGAGATNAADYVCTVTLKHSTASAGTYTTVTNGTGTAMVFTTAASNGVGRVVSSKLEAEVLKRYLRLEGAAVGQDGSFGGVFLYSK